MRRAAEWGVSLAIVAASFTLGLATRPAAPAAPDPPPDLPLAPSAFDAASAPRPAASVGDPQGAELDAELDRTRQLERELYGVPGMWPDPDARAEAEREAQALLDDALACLGSGWSEVERVCDEPPCLGALWGPADARPDGFRACGQAAGIESMQAWPVACSTGRRLVWLTASGDPGGSDERRRRVRWEALRDRAAAACGAPPADR